MKIRKAVRSDAMGIARVHVDSWKTTYANIVPDEYLNNLNYERREQLWINNILESSVYVAETEDDTIVGFSTGGKERSGKYPNYIGEIYAIYLLKEYQRKGIGKLLVKPLIEELIQQNIFTMLVLVLEKNNSRYFYESFGARMVDSIQVEIAGKKLGELVYGWKDIRNIR